MAATANPNTMHTAKAVPRPSLSHRLPLSRLSPLKEPPLTVLRCLLLLAKLLACLPACLRTKSSLTLQSLYIYGIPAAPPTFRRLLLYLLVFP